MSDVQQRFRSDSLESYANYECHSYVTRDDSGDDRGVELSHVVESLTDRNCNQTVDSYIPSPILDDTEREIEFASLRRRNQHTTKSSVQ